MLIGGIGTGSIHLTTVEIYDVASDSWRISGTASVNLNAKFFVHVQTGDFYALHGSLVYRYDEATEIFNALTDLVVDSTYPMDRAQIVTAVPGANANCRPF